MESVDFIDLDDLFFDFPDAITILDMEPPVIVDEAATAGASPESWINEVETMLMNDDNNQLELDPDFQIPQDFLDDVLADSPLSGACEVLDGPTGSPAEDDSGVSDKEKQKTDTPSETEVDDPADPASKKLRRQMRNRDAAVRSRERKKVYVRDLEMKSKYLEGECRRLGRLLQFCISENQALRFSLQNSSALGSSSTKQESAVLLLESLLLGSLLWFLGIMCLSNPPTLLLEEVPVESAGQDDRRRVVPRDQRSRLVQAYVKSRRCRASRKRIKQECYMVGIAA